MPASPAGRSPDAVVMRAALVFPGGVPPPMGPDTIRLPVRVVWRTVAPSAGPAAGLAAGPAAATGLPGAAALPGGGRSAVQPPSTPMPASRAARPPSPVLSLLDPIGTMLAINAALNRLSPPADPGAAADGHFADQPTAEPIDYWTSDVNNRTARDLGMTRDELGEAIHKLKRNRLRGDDNLQIHIPTGTVYFNGEYFGNLFDE